MAIGVLPLWMLSYRSHHPFPPTNTTSSSSLSHQHAKQWRVVLFGMILPLYLWLVLILPRPHKEERFLYPIYPLFCLNAALVIDVLLDGLAIRFFQLSQAPTFVKWTVQGAVWLPSTVLSALRMLALCKYYSAPMMIYATLSSHIQNNRQHDISSFHVMPSPSKVVVCTCGEWYRFPSSFYLPDNVTLGFLPSSFRGQLPQLFTNHGSRGESQRNFNDENREQEESYVLDSAICQYVVALEGENCGELGFNHSHWKSIVQWPLLNPEKTASTLHRAIYLPLWHQRVFAKRRSTLREIGSV